MVATALQSILYWPASCPDAATDPAPDQPGFLPAKLQLCGGARQGGDSAGGGVEADWGGAELHHGEQLLWL